MMVLGCRWHNPPGGQQWNWPSDPLSTFLGSGGILGFHVSVSLSRKGHNSHLYLVLREHGPNQICWMVPPIKAPTLGRGLDLPPYSLGLLYREIIFEQLCLS
jgi:hypothetical protein